MTLWPPGPLEQSVKRLGEGRRRRLVAVGEVLRGVPLEDVLRHEPRVERRFVVRNPGRVQLRARACHVCVQAHTVVASFSFSVW